MLQGLTARQHSDRTSLTCQCTHICGANNSACLAVFKEQPYSEKVGPQAQTPPHSCTTCCATHDDAVDSLCWGLVVLLCSHSV